jgi:hypothetical protein
MRRRLLKSGFAVQVFDRPRARSPDLLAFLQIYLQYLAPEHRTKTNELVAFLADPLPGQVIVYFGLTYRGKPCGIATLMLYPASQVAVIDHIAIAPTERGYGAFFAFCEHIADYIEQEQTACNYLIAEIILSDQPVTTGLNALALIRLSRFVGFRVANVPYYAPDTQIPSNRKSCRAALAIFSQPEKNAIDPSEFMRLLRVIFFDHYRAWHERTMNSHEFAIYDEAARKEYDALSSFVADKQFITINGMRNFDLPYVLDPARKPNLNLLGATLLVAVPAALTIVLAVMQAIWIAVVVLAIVVVVFGLAMVPKLRGPILKFFQLEQ